MVALPKQRARALRLEPSANVWLPSEMSDAPGPLLLDTHVWVWMLEGRRDKLRPDALTLLNQASGQGRLFVSDISFWEVATKAAKGKLVLTIDPVLWLEKAAAAPGLKPIALDRRTLIQSTRLQQESQTDPADRMLMATAQLMPATLLTADEAIIAYAQQWKSIGVCDLR